MNHSMIIRNTLKVFHECKIRSFPIDCFHIIKHYGYTVYTYEELKIKSHELYEMCLEYSEDAFRDGHSKIIAYNQDRLVGRIRFSLMHELGHHILEHKNDSPDNEQEANAFASNLLAPRMAIHYARCKSPDDVSEVFRMTHEAARYAYDDYKAWHRNASKQMSDLDKAMYGHFYQSGADCFVWSIKTCEFCKKTLYNSIHSHCDFCNIPDDDIYQTRYHHYDIAEHANSLRGLEHQWLYGE